VKSFAQVLLLALLWGVAYPLTKLSVETIGPITVAAVRALLGSALLFAVLGRRIAQMWQPGMAAKSYLAQGMLNCVIPWILVAWASRTIDSSLATILNSLSPIFIFLLTWGITRHEPATARKFVGVALGLAGVLVIVGFDALSGLGEHTLAELACVAGSVSYGVAAIRGRRFDRVSPLVPAAGATAMASLVLVPLALVVERPWTASPSMASMLAVLGLAIFSTGFAFVLYFRLLSKIGSIATASQAYLRIAIGVGLGILFLGERPTLQMLAGLVLVIAAVVAMTWPARAGSMRA
jgi:drug/metabolite transporter (DMT)-like permease